MQFVNALTGIIATTFIGLGITMLAGGNSAGLWILVAGLLMLAMFIYVARG